MLCAVCGIAPNVVENQAAYIKTWLERLKGREDSATLLVRAEYVQLGYAVSIESLNGTG